ncbi:MAG: nucleotidyltransferase domain-containing protein [Chloroflexota bacterium]
MSEPQQANRPRHLFNVPQSEKPAVIIQAMSDMFTTLFPDRIRAIYLIGSQTDQSAASMSDIDGGIIFKDAFSDETEQSLAESMLAYCRRLSPIRLDFMVLAEDHPKLYTTPDIRLKQGSRLIYGEDIRDKLPTPTLDVYKVDMQDWATNFLTNLHELETLPITFTYPQPDDEFYGYTIKRAHYWYPAEVTAGTKELVATICWCATALLAMEHDVMVSTRAECIAMSQQHLGPKRGAFVAEAYELCKREWDYQVPTGEGERWKLREICDEALEFFNRTRTVL